MADVCYPATMLRSSNPAGWGVLPPMNAGSTNVAGSVTGGGFRRAMDSRSIYSYGVSSKGNRKVGDLILNGTFDYREEQHEGRCWGDVADPYSGNPYIVGGDVPGSYHRQAFDFSAGLATFRGEHFKFGAAAGYKVGDFSRSNDPRTRSQMADYGLEAGLVWNNGPTYRSGSSKLGATLSWYHHKEKMEKPVAKGSPLDAFKYYDYRGLADYVPVGLLLFSRRYIANTFAAGVQYWGFYSHSNLYTALHFSHKGEDVVGNTGETPGDWTEDRIDFSSAFASRFGIFNLEMSLSSGSALRTLQQQVSELNEEGMAQMYWKTLMSNVYYKALGKSVSLSWQTHDYRPWKARATWEGMDRTILLPLSEESTGRLSLNVGRDGLNLGKNLFYGGYLGIFLPAGNSISLDPSLDSTPVIRDNVVLPDHAFMSSRALTTGASLRWNFSAGKIPFYLDASLDGAFSLDGLGSRLGGTLIFGFRH